MGNKNQEHEQGQNRVKAAAQAGISVSTMKRLIQRRQFPSGRKLGSDFRSRRLWLESEIDAWLRGDWVPPAEGGAA